MSINKMEKQVLKVLFVSSGNSKYGISPIIKSQGETIRGKGIHLDYFLVVGKGLLGYFKNLFRLRKYLKHSNYDIIHAHYALSGILSFLAKREEKQF